jgi:excisionase family DNA binding protein
MATQTTPKTPQLTAAKRTSVERGVPYGSLRDAVFRGELPVVRIGRAWYFDNQDVDRWIESLKARG